MIKTPVKDESIVERHGFMGINGYWVKNLTFSIGDDTWDNCGTVKVIGIDGEFRYITKEEFETVAKVLRLEEMVERDGETCR